MGDDILYFCEDGGKELGDCGVHGRDSSGRFFSILDGPGYVSETTGLAFSPNKRHMYVRRAGSFLQRIIAATPRPLPGNSAERTRGLQRPFPAREDVGQLLGLLDFLARELSVETGARLRYVSFQTPGVIFDITRDDGLPFDGGVLDIKYHGD